MCARRRDRNYLEDIQEAMERIASYTSGLSFDDFMKDTKTQDAVIRNLEIIGEATKRISEAVRKTHDDMPWKEMAGTRDKVIHDYFGINYDIVWRVATGELPKLSAEIQRILSAERGKPSD